MTSKPRKATIETIEVVVGGKTYRGQRIVTGVHELHQAVQFEARRKRDVDDYQPGDGAFMRVIAKVILRDLMGQWTARGVRRPVKVKPGGQSRRRCRGEGS